MKKMFRTILIGILLHFVCVASVSAALVTTSTGDLGNNVINNAGFYEVSLNSTNPSNILGASIDVKYGLWNSPIVAVSVFFNSNIVGSFTADQGYISPGPKYASFDVTGLLINGSNSISFNGFGTNDGDYVIGKVDLNYDNASASVPIPGTIILLSTGILGLAGFRRKKINMK